MIAIGKRCNQNICITRHILTRISKNCPIFFLQFAQPKFVFYTVSISEKFLREEVKKNLLELDIYYVFAGRTKEIFFTIPFEPLAVQTANFLRNIRNRAYKNNHTLSFK